MPDRELRHGEAGDVEGADGRWVVVETAAGMGFTEVEPEGVSSEGWTTHMESWTRQRTCRGGSWRTLGASSRVSKESVEKEGRMERTFAEEEMDGEEDHVLWHGAELSSESESRQGYDYAKREAGGKRDD